jgi:hypothetical protein
VHDNHLATGAPTFKRFARKVYAFKGDCTVYHTHVSALQLRRQPVASTTATFFSVYTTTIGTTTVRPLVRFGSAPTGDHALQELDANEVIVTSATFTPDLDADQTVNYDQTTGVFSVGAVVKDNSQLSDEGEQELNRLRDLSRDLVSADMNEVLTDRQRSKIRAYRRALKNLPYSRTWPTTVSYPTAPSSPEPTAPVPLYRLNVGEPANRAVSVTRAGAVAKRFNESGIMRPYRRTRHGSTMIP